MQHVGPEAEALERAGTEVLDQHVGVDDQTGAARRGRSVGLQVERDRPLVAVDQLPPQALAVARVAPRQVAQAVATVGPLDLDHVGAEVGEVAGAVRARPARSTDRSPAVRAAGHHSSHRRRPSSAQHVVVGRQRAAACQRRQQHDRLGERGHQADHHRRRRRRQVPSAAPSPAGCRACAAPSSVARVARYSMNIILPADVSTTSSSRGRRDQRRARVPRWPRSRRPGRSARAPRARPRSATPAWTSASAKATR